MKKKMLLSGLFLVIGQLAFARGPATKLATPGFEDPTNAASVYTTLVDSMSTRLIYSPIAIRDVRRIQVFNPSNNSVLHITTWTFTTPATPVNSTITINTWAIPVATITAAFALDLNAKTTFYGIFEERASTTVVRVLELWDDPSKYPR